MTEQTLVSRSVSIPRSTAEVTAMVSHKTTTVRLSTSVIKGGIAGVGANGASVPTAASAGTIQTSTADRWGRDAHMVEGIFQIIEGMEPPWITLNVLESAAVRFPTVDREILRLTIMTVIMTQRPCVVRLIRAGLRLGPRTDRDGNTFVELDLDYVDRYSTSH